MLQLKEDLFENQSGLSGWRMKLFLVSREMKNFNLCTKNLITYHVLCTHKATHACRKTSPVKLKVELISAKTRLIFQNMFYFSDR